MKKILRHPHFRIILTEWVAYLEAKTENAKSFAIWFLGVMAEAEARKSRPRLREQCAEFALAIQGCPWDLVKAALPPQLSRHRAFLGPKADRFYKAFRQRVTRHVRDYVNELQKAVLQGNRESWAHPAVDPILRRFPGLSQEKGGETVADKDFPSDHSPDQSIEESQANLIAAARARLGEPDARCLDCGKIARWPTAFHWSAYKGWTVETLTHLPDGWLILEERVPVFQSEHGGNCDVSTKLMCPECRTERSL